MIEPQDAMPLLVAACPSFSREWEEHVQENGYDLQYVAAGAFARHLLSLYESKDVAVFSAVAAAIERLHVEGSPWVREFATIGVLEGVQNVWSHSQVRPEEFFVFLGPEGKRWWRGLNEFWSGKAPYVRAEG
jgi:hypothetical protein